MRRENGFTLIELLVVISIIGILAGLLLVNVVGIRERGRDTKRKTDISEIKKGLRMYYNDQDPQQYPESSLTGSRIVACGDDADPGNCSWGEVWSRNNMIYMKILPQDPIYNADTGLPTYNYYQGEDTQDFCLWATLENHSDADITRSQSRCSGCSVDNYDYVVCAD